MTKAEIDAFETELDALCKKHGVVVDHEDHQGAGLIRRAAPGEEARCGISFHLRSLPRCPYCNETGLVPAPYEGGLTTLVGCPAGCSTKS
jgi:hypothetical protein